MIEADGRERENPCPATGALAQTPYAIPQSPCHPLLIVKWIPEIPTFRLAFLPEISTYTSKNP